MCSAVWYIHFKHWPVILFQLRKTYGNVYSLYLGSKPAVFINGLEAMKEALVTKAKEFAGRPQDLFVNDTTDRKGEKRHDMS